MRFFKPPYCRKFLLFIFNKRVFFCLKSFFPRKCVFKSALLPQAFSFCFSICAFRAFFLIARNQVVLSRPTAAGFLFSQYARFGKDALFVNRFTRFRSHGSHFFLCESVHVFRFRFDLRLSWHSHAPWIPLLPCHIIEHDPIWATLTIQVHHSAIRQHCPCCQPQFASGTTSFRGRTITIHYDLRRSYLAPKNT